MTQRDSNTARVQDSLAGSLRTETLNCTFADPGAPTAPPPTRPAHSAPNCATPSSSTASTRTARRPSASAAPCDSPPWAASRILGRDRDLGSVEPGKLADLALWDLTGFRHASIADPVAALVLGAAAPLTLLLVNGRTVVEDGRLTTDDEQRLARLTRAEAHRLARLRA